MQGKSGVKEGENEGTEELRRVRVRSIGEEASRTILPLRGWYSRAHQYLPRADSCMNSTRTLYKSIKAVRNLFVNYCSINN